MGTAYAFFHCNASKTEIVAELPTIISLTEAPSGLELTLMETPEFESRVEQLLALQPPIKTLVDAALLPVIEEAKKNQLGYVLSAYYPVSMQSRLTSFRSSKTSRKTRLHDLFSSANN